MRPFGVKPKPDKPERLKILSISWRGKGYRAWTTAGGTLRKSPSQRRKSRLLYPYLQKQVGGEGVNFASILAGLGIVVILGGTGSLLGALVGSFLIGFLYNFGQALFPDLAYVILFLPMLLVLVLRPQGLFGRVVS